MRKQIKPPTQSEKRRQIAEKLRVAPELSEDRLLRCWVYHLRRSALYGGI